MKNFEQVLARYSEEIGPIIVPRRNHHLTAGVIVNSSQPITSSDVKIIVVASDGFYALILPDIQLVMFRDFAVVLERFQAIRLGIGCAKRNIANFKELRRGEKNHVCRIVKNRVHYAALIDADDL